jgi:hypothetical protein
MEQDKNKLQKVEGNINIDDKGLVLRTYDDLWKFSSAIFKSKDLCPKHLTSAESVLVAIQMGFELGLKPLQSIQNIAVINGIPSIFGDAAKALVLSSGTCELFEEYYEGKPYDDDYTAVCITKRKGARKEHVERFSVKQAKLAKLWQKAGTWQTYPDRMLKFRARGFNLRDNFTDILKGFKTVEEVSDYVIVDSKTNNNNKSGGSKFNSIMNDEPPE